MSYLVFVVITQPEGWWKIFDVCSIVAWRRYCIFVCDVFGRDRLQYGFFCPCRAPANISRVQAAAAGAEWHGTVAGPLHVHSGGPAQRQAAAPEDT